MVVIDWTSLIDGIANLVERKVFLARDLSLRPGECPRRPTLTLDRDFAVAVETRRTQPFAASPPTKNLIYSKTSDEDRSAPATGKCVPKSQRTSFKLPHFSLRITKKGARPQIAPAGEVDAFAEAAAAITCGIFNASRNASTNGFSAATLQDGATAAP